MEVNVSKFDLIPFANEVASHFEEEAIQRNIELIISNKTKIINIWADPSMLEKIIFNLLSNAFKATPGKGKVELDIQETKLEMYFPLIKNKRAVELKKFVYTMQEKLYYPPHSAKQEMLE